MLHPVFFKCAEFLERYLEADCLLHMQLHHVLCVFGGVEEREREKKGMEGRDRPLAGGGGVFFNVLFLTHAGNFTIPRKVAAENEIYAIFTLFKVSSIVNCFS